MTNAHVSEVAFAAPEELFDEEFFRLARECPVEAWLSFLGHRWNALILYHLGRGAKRFGEIADALPSATAKVLTERIVALERHGLIQRPNGARGEAYALTRHGEALLDILDRMELWSRDFPTIDLAR